MNAYTTIEESKQLIEAGLDISTADGYIQHKWEEISQNHHFQTDYGEKIPCWSLAALIELLPDHIEYWDKEGYFYDAFLEISKYSVAYRYFDQYQDMKIQLFEAFNESLVSSVSITIIWLLENNFKI